MGNEGIHIEAIDDWSRRDTAAVSVSIPYMGNEENERTLQMMKNYILLFQFPI